MYLSSVEISQLNTDEDSLDCKGKHNKGLHCRISLLVHFWVLKECHHQNNIFDRLIWWSYAISAVPLKVMNDIFNSFYDWLSKFSKLSRAVNTTANTSNINSTTKQTNMSIRKLTLQSKSYTNLCLEQCQNVHWYHNLLIRPTWKMLAP